MAERSAEWLLAALVGASALGLLRLGLGWWRLRRFLAEQEPLRSLGRAHVLASDATGTPFSATQVGLMTGSDQQRVLWAAALERSAEARKTLEPILKKHGVPVELVAVAMVESGFRNLAPEPPDSGRRGAGMWQLIPETARHFGLTVDESRDERMDVSTATGAAARYLKDLHRRFGCWPLAIAAYTHGESRVEAVVASAGTRDASALVKSGGLSPYSSQVLAAMLLAERPELVR